MSVTLNFHVCHQNITRADSCILVADSLNYAYAHFDFCSSDWDGLIKTAVFTRGQDTYEQILEDDQCLIPWEMLPEGKGIFTVSVFAGNRITTNVVKVKLDASGWSFALESSQPPTEGVYSQILTRLANVEDTVVESAESAAQSATSAAESAQSAEQSMEAAQTAKSAAEEAAANVTQYSKTAESWAVGGTGTRTGEDTDNSKYYAEQAGAASRTAVSAGNTATDAAQTASAAASHAAGSAQTAAEGAQIVQELYDGAVSDITAAKTAAVGAIQTKGDQVIDSIPADYSDLSDDVTQLKADSNQKDSLFVACESGAYGSAGTNKVAYPSMIRNAVSIYAKELFSVTIPSGYEAAFIYLDKNGNKISETTQLRGEVLSSAFVDGAVYINLNVRNIATPSADISAQVGIVENGIKLSLLSHVNVKDITAVMERMTACDGIVNIDPDDFEVGGIEISNTGWIYFNLNRRVRTKEGVTFALTAGSIIGLSDYTDARFYLGARLGNGTYWSKGWNTSDVVLPYDGEYVIVISNITEVALNDKSDLLKLLFVRESNNAVKKSEKLNVNFMHKMPTLLEVGNIGITSSGWDYSYHINRARTPYGTTLPLNNGDIIEVSDYSKYMMYIGWLNADGEYKYKGWVADRYIVEEDGDYVILLSTTSNSKPDSMKEMMDSLTIYHAYSARDIISAMQRPKQQETFIKSVNHRGYNFVAPENTLPAYELSKEHGFQYVETDVAFTSDGIAVLLHDGTINRTARNADGTELSDEVSIYDITYEQAQTYDFGIWKGATYAGTKIPTLEQFIELCKKLGLHPYIELKTDGSYTQAQIASAVNLVKSYGMRNNVSWISFSNTYLSYVKEIDNTARLGYLCGEITEEVVATAKTLKTSYNDVFIDASNSAITDETISYAIVEGIPVETWTLNAIEQYKALNSYITGVTSDELIADIVLNTR